MGSGKSTMGMKLSYRLRRPFLDTDKWIERAVYKRQAFKRFLLTLVCGALTIALSACSGDKAGEDSSQITIGIPQDLSLIHIYLRCCGGAAGISAV